MEIKMLQEFRVGSDTFQKGSFIWRKESFELFLETCKDGRIWIKEIEGSRGKIACRLENTLYKISSISIWVEHGMDKREIQRVDWT